MTADLTDPTAEPDEEPHRQRRWRPLAKEPVWWVRDIVIAVLVGAFLVVGQNILDDFRSGREAEREQRLADSVEQLGNLRSSANGQSSEWWNGHTPGWI